MPALAAAALSAALLAFPAAQPPTTTPTPVAPPSVLQLCAATGQAEIDALLDGVATSALVGELAPLASIAVPDSQAPTTVGTVQLDSARTALNCAALDDDVTPTTTPVPPTTPPVTDQDCEDYETQAQAQDALDADPADPFGLDLDGDGIACEAGETAPTLAEDDGGQVGRVPTGGVDTGDGSTRTTPDDLSLVLLLSALGLALAPALRHCR